MYKKISILTEKIRNILVHEVADRKFRVSVNLG